MTRTLACRLATVGGALGVAVLACAGTASAATAGVSANGQTPVVTVQTSHLDAPEMKGDYKGDKDKDKDKDKKKCECEHKGDKGKKDHDGDKWKKDHDGDKDKKKDHDGDKDKKSGYDGGKESMKGGEYAGYQEQAYGERQDGVLEDAVYGLGHVVRILL
jgi:hypothetical protein